VTTAFVRSKKPSLMVTGAPVEEVTERRFEQ